MFGRKKEKKVKEAIKQHLHVVSETVYTMYESVRHYVAGDIKKSSELAFQTHQNESRADGLRRSIISDLYTGAFFPTVREDIIHYIAQQDNIADRAESCCDFIVAQRPYVPGEFADDLVKLATGNIETIKPLVDAVDNYFDDHKKIRENIKQVNTHEEELDALEWHLTERVFKSEELSLAQKIHLRELIFHVVHISDVTEDAADMLDSAVIKKSI